MVYADYPYYSGEYGGGLMPADIFEKLAPRASRIMDRDCAGRLEEYGDRAFVKDCCCAVVEELYLSEQEKAAGGVVKSEARGKVSVSFDTGAAAGRGKSERARIYAVLQAYLGAWGLLYNGQ